MPQCDYPVCNNASLYHEYVFNIHQMSTDIFTLCTLINDLDNDDYGNIKWVKELLLRVV